VLATIGEITLRDEHTSIVFDFDRSSVDVNISQRDGKPILTQCSLVTRPVVDKHVPSIQKLASIVSLPNESLDCRYFDPLLVIIIMDCYKNCFREIKFLRDKLHLFRLK